MTELRSCPFCGGEAVLHKERVEGYSIVLCKNCHAKIERFKAGSCESWERAVSAWNRRDGKHGES